MTTHSLITIAEQLLLAVKMNTKTQSLSNQLEQADIDHLDNELDTDMKKKAFWINIYNAYFQILRKEKQIDKPDIYKKKHLVIAGKKLSLDDVEHGILRRYRYKYSLGFFGNIFTPKYIKKLAVDTIDYRIHFALNCGAKSCPPIAFYNVDKLDVQLDMATQSFLEGETIYNEEKKEVHTTALFKWFKGDFGGSKGIRYIYKSQLQKDISGYTIVYNDYSWEEVLDNFNE